MILSSCRSNMTFRQAVCFNYLLAFAIASNALLMINSRLLHSFIAVVQVLALIAMVTVLMSTRARGVDQAAAGRPTLEKATSAPQLDGGDRMLGRKPAA